MQRLLGKIGERIGCAFDGQELKLRSKNAA
jgi:hypothetical protein